ncbi:hypothetical protein ERO13_D11G124733v2 [Gossypium hirsutum]|uniref:Uncharacterized protein n=1 Tax=Gossypium darwinii TaxID=34276 RepID=A0A5D2AJG7_GOSDA|nr:hypothetical protein ERO13_D11G124733v2 [Gossypium hirsutum]TYG44974.1 hypothetical protein ES288_D11G137900v1 [Gossypium darwinii]
MQRATCARCCASFGKRIMEVARSQILTKSKGCPESNVTNTLSSIPSRFCDVRKKSMSRVTPLP